MTTYTAQAAAEHFADLLDKAAHGETVLITDHDKPIAKLIPAEGPESYRDRVRALRGFVKGIDTTVER